MESNGTTQTEKQHYVPKFLLRRFSHQNNQKEIGVFNTNTNFFRYKCALRDQAYKHFLYGKDGVVEDILSKQIEGPNSSLIKNIIETNTVPHANTDDFIKLLEFVIVSHLRTPKLGDRANASSDRLARVMLEHNKELSAIAEDYEFGFENPVVNNLEFIKSSVVSCLDLKLYY